MIQIQHCQRYNWPEGWVQLTKVSQPRFNFMTLQISFPAAKCWPNSSSKILPELQLQNLDQTLCSKSEPKFSSITKPQLPNMQQTVANKVLIINISNSYNINNFWVSEWVSDKHSQWSDSGPIKISFKPTSSYFAETFVNIFSAAKWFRLPLSACCEVFVSALDTDKMNFNLCVKFTAGQWIELTSLFEKDNWFKGGRSWQAFGERRKCLQFFRRVRIC